MKFIKAYQPISFYLFLFALVAIFPAGVTTLLSVKNADGIQHQAQLESQRRARSELLKEVQHLGDEMHNITMNLAGWDETRALLVDSTYYNYWKTTRAQEFAQYEGLVDGVDLYNKAGFALTNEVTLASKIQNEATRQPMFVSQTGKHYLVYYQPITLGTEQQTPVLGYVGVRMNMDRAAGKFSGYEHSLIRKISWRVTPEKTLTIEQAVEAADLDIIRLPEIKAFSDLIRDGFSEYFLYATTLVVLLMLLLYLSIGRPLSRLSGFVKDIYSGRLESIPENFHGLIRISELEGVRQAINDYKNRFQSAAESLEEKNRELMQLTYHDPLTGRFNRRAFEARVEHAMETAIVEGKEHALCYIDLDQFKVVNDTCGHMGGDELLKQVAALIEGEIRECDMLARLGGDEFGVLLDACHVDKAAEIVEAMRLKVKTHRFLWQDKHMDISISVGLVPITSENAVLEEVFKNADAACYVAKDNGRNRMQIYQAHDEELAQRYGEMQWVSRIRQALDENRFELFAQLIQPIKNDNKQAHYEILIRLRDTNGELVPPMAFIPAAERYNMMQEIDAWVIKESLSAIKQLEQVGAGDLMLSINLSGQSIGNADVLEVIKQEIINHGVNPKQLCFEITETAAITNLSTAVRFIRNLRALGCKFSLDDFGSGLSSFGYLSNLEVDYIKIDGEFIKTIQANPISHSIVSAINQIGHVMGVKTIAEFVESESVIKSLTEVGIDYVQGFGVHKPEPLLHLHKRLAKTAWGRLVI